MVTTNEVDVEQRIAEKPYVMQGFPASMKGEIVYKHHHYSRVNREEGDSSKWLYDPWKLMTYVCENPNRKDYKYYGDKGIKVCPEWHFPENFQNFLAWAYAQGYDEGDFVKIIRLDKNGDFCPENCRLVPFTPRPKKVDVR